MVFQINAKRILLTYAQSEFELPPYVDWIKSRGATAGILCSELHRDGNLHRHALLYFPDGFRSRDPRCFDYLGRHPKVERCRSWSGALTYVKKGPDILEWGDLPCNKKAWKDILPEASNTGELLQLIEENYPRDFILNYDRIKSFAYARFDDSGTFNYSSEFTNFVLPDVLSAWVSSELRSIAPRRKSLILVSPTRFGKTEWARSLGKHHYFNGMVNFRKWFNSSELEYVVFDDIEWDNVKSFKKQWFGCQREFEVTDKYMAKKTIKYGVPLIYLCNDCPPLDAWMLGNVVVIDLVSPLFIV